MSDDREKADLSAAWHDDDLEDLFENAPCGYLSADPSGRIFKVNATFTAWTGFSAETLVGRRFQELLNIAGRIYYETHFAPLLRMQGFFNEVALDFVCADGQALHACRRKALGSSMGHERHGESKRQQSRPCELPGRTVPTTPPRWDRCPTSG